MSNIKITLIPTPKNFQILDLFIGGNGIGNHEDLDELQIPMEADWRKGIIINGKAPIWLYAFCVHQCHPAACIAVMDPRHGGIVVESHHPAAPIVGTTIPLEDFQEYLPKHKRVPQNARSPTVDRCRCIAFVGPPHSGKSVLVRTVYDRLRAKMPIEQFQQDVFLIRACPDGEGNWFGEIPVDRALTLRSKSEWNQGFVDQISAYLERITKNKALVLVDFGGKIDRYKQQILNRCSDAVIVSQSLPAVAEWRGAVQASGVKVIAEIESVQTEVCEVIDRHPLRLRIGPLERGRPNSDLPRELLETIQRA